MVEAVRGETCSALDVGQSWLFAYEDERLYSRLLLRPALIYKVYGIAVPEGRQKIARGSRLWLF